MESNIRFGLSLLIFKETAIKYHFDTVHRKQSIDFGNDLVQFIKVTFFFVEEKQKSKNVVT